MVHTYSELTEIDVLDLANEVVYACCGDCDQDLTVCADDYENVQRAWIECGCGEYWAGPTIWAIEL